MRASERHARVRRSGNDLGDFQPAPLNTLASAFDGVRFSKRLHDWVVKLLSNPSCEFNWPEFRKNELAELEEEALLSIQVGLDERYIVARS
jgi:hypothetical protein